ncbi:MAG: Lpg1974 family pore-forming outer membrane protein, partial [Pirellulaceae bacterium]|nr:Lpg1974 family pore-forming outer membrane protein [Pirellulaceae bacterium]
MEPNQSDPNQNTPGTQPLLTPLAPAPGSDFSETLQAAPTDRQSRFTPAPTPTGTFFYSDLHDPGNTASPGNVAETRQETLPSYDEPAAPWPAAPWPTAPLPGMIASPLYAIPPATARALNPPSAFQPLAPLPTPVIPSPVITAKNQARSIPAAETSLLGGNDQPASFTNYGNLILRQDPTASPNDVKQTPAQKGCSKWCRTVNLWGEFLYLRSRDSEVTYGVESNTSLAPPAPPVQVGSVGMVDQTADPGFRFGITYMLDESSSLTASWAMLESHRSDRIDRTSLSNVIQSSVLHPSTAAATSSGTFATGIHDIDFDLVDLEYRGKLSSSETTETNYVVGLRYVYLQQQFLHDNNILGNQTVATDIDFNGLGVRLGLEGERFRHKSRWFVYGKSYVNFVAGEFNAK